MLTGALKANADPHCWYFRRHVSGVFLIITGRQAGVVWGMFGKE